MYLFVLLIFSEITTYRISCISINELPFSFLLEEFGRKIYDYTLYLCLLA
jgi:hypothetical protein